MTDTATTTAPATTTDGATTTTATTTKPWYDGMDTEMIGHWDNKGWKKDDPKALATELTKAWKGLEKHFGVPADQILKMPKDGDTAEHKAFWQKLGVPGEAKDYDLSGIKFNGADLEAGFADKMRAALLAGNVPKGSATNIVKSVVEYLESADNAETTERSAKLQIDRTALEKEWGNNFEFNRLTASQGARRLGVSEDDVAKLQDTLGYKRTMELFHKIGQGTTEDTFVDVNKSGNPTTRNGAQARLSELKSDPEWVNRYLAGGVSEKREFDNLMASIHGEAA